MGKRQSFDFWWDVAVTIACVVFFAPATVFFYLMPYPEMRFSLALVIGFVLICSIALGLDILACRTKNRAP